MATLQCTIKTLNNKPIEGLTIMAFYKKGDAKEENTHLTKTDKKGYAELRVHPNVKFFIGVFEGNRLLKKKAIPAIKVNRAEVAKKEAKGKPKNIKSNKSKKTVIAEEPRKKISLNIDPLKLSFNRLPQDETNFKESQTLLAKAMTSTVLNQFQDKKEKALIRPQGLQQRIEKYIQSNWSKIFEQNIADVSEDIVFHLKKEKTFSDYLKRIEQNKNPLKQSVGDFLQLNLPLSQNRWLQDSIKENIIDETANSLVAQERIPILKKLLIEDQDGDTDFWEKLEKNKKITKAEKGKIRQWIDMASVIGDDVYILKQLIDKKAINGIKINTDRDLIQLRKTDWKKLINEKDVPINGTSDDYIRILENRVASKYPYAYIMDRFVAGDFVEEKEEEQFLAAYKQLFSKQESPKQIKEQLSREDYPLMAFFKEFPSLNLNSLSLLEKEIEVNGKKHKWGKKGKNKDTGLTTIIDPVQKHLLAMQRIFRLAPSYSTAAALLKKGLHTAQSVSRLPLFELEKQLKEINPHIPQKSIIQLKARAERRVSQIMDYVANLHSLYSNFHFDTNVDPTLIPMSGQPQGGQVPISLNQELKKIPGWEIHFGSQTYCQCAHCQSIFSPGAYFVDLMQYIKWGAIYKDDNGELIDDQEGYALHLKKRRSDLWEIPLNCENAHREIPYLEVVNEVLESYIKNTLLGEDADFHLNASINGNISTTNLSFLHPINYHFEELKVLLSHFDLTLFDLQISPTETIIFNDQKVRAILGITLEELKAITEENDTINTIRFGEALENETLDIASFIKKTEISRADLQYIIDAKTVRKNENPQIKQQLIQNEVNRFSPEKITNFSNTLADRFFRFVRLWQLSPWSVKELDFVLNDLPFNNETVHKVAKLLYIQGHLELSLEEVIGISAAIPSISINTTIEKQTFTNLEFEQNVPSLLYRLFKPIQTEIGINEKMSKDDLIEKIIIFFNNFYHPCLDTRSEAERVIDTTTDLSKAAALRGILKLSDEDLEQLFLKFVTEDTRSIKGESISIKGEVNLSIDIINQLYRYAKLSDALDLSINDLLLITELHWDNDQDRIINNEDDVIELITANEVLKTLPLNLAELQFVTKELNSNYILNENIVHALNATKEGLVNSQISFSEVLNIFLDVQENQDVNANDSITLITSLFKTLTDEKFLINKNIDDGQIVDNLKSVYFVTEENPYKSIDLQTLLDNILGAGQHEFKKQFIKKLDSKPNIFYTFLSILTDLSLPLTRATLRLIEDNAITNSQIHLSSRRILSEIDSISKGLEVDFADSFNQILNQLFQITLIVKQFGFSKEELNLLIDLDIAPNLGLERRGNTPRFRGLKQIENIKRLVEFQYWLKLAKKNEYDVAEWIKALENSSIPNEKASVRDELADVLGITKDQLNLILFEIPETISIDRLKKLREIAGEIKRLGIGIGDLNLIKNLGEEQFNWEEENLWTYLFELWIRHNNIKQAKQSVLNAFKSKYKTEAAWQEVWSPYEKKLLEIKREILVDYILNWRNHPDNRLLPNQAVGGTQEYYEFKSTNDLYHYFLLDSEMSGCAVVSKLKAATLSLQLYIQRIFLQLESSKDGSFTSEMREGYAQQWVWRKNYRIWEANRKVFLYPENYIEPEWRDNKSPQFKLLEEDLMQEEVNEESVKLAYKLYFNRFVEISNLNISGNYYDENRNTYYFFGRTTSVPYLYYYREYVPKSENKPEKWTPWKKIDLTIIAQRVSSIYYLGKLFLFWVEEKEVQENQSSVKRYQIIYSLKNNQDKWSIPQRIDALFHNDFVPFVTEQFGELVIETNIYYRQDIMFGNAWVVKKRYFSFYKNSFISIKNSSISIPNYSNYLLFNISNGILERHKRLELYPAALSNANYYGYSPSLAVLEHYISENISRNSNKIIISAFIEDGIKTELLPFYNKSYFLKRNDGAFLMSPISERNIKILRIDTSVPNLLEKKIDKVGLNKFISFTTQKNISEKNFAPFSIGAEQDLILIAPNNPEHINFEGSYGLYFNELFFHIPFLIAKHLNANQKFKEAKWWYERIFNPFAVSTPEENADSSHFWEFLPFREVASNGVSTLKEQLQNTQQIGAYEDEPFMPHKIARSRTDAYMKTIVMKYIDNLLDWGDYLFTRDSFESINEAMMLYILAQDILGERPVELGPCKSPAVSTYEKIEDELKEGKQDDFLIYVENYIDQAEEESATNNISATEADTDQSPNTDMADALPYFCIPLNKDMLSYWSRVEDRLFKIRNCMNIRGQKRKLSLYEPPIDPRLLVAARASGLSLEDAIASVLGGGNLPNYRFNTILSKARDFVGTVQSFGSALLSAVEKKDTEQLSLLRSTHEQNILKLSKQTKKNQIAEARAQVTNLQEAKINVQNRVDHFSSLIEIGLIPNEKTSQSKKREGSVLINDGSTYFNVANALDLIPKILGLSNSTGGDEAARSMQMFGEFLKLGGEKSRNEGDSAGIEAGNQRRKQEWKQQLKLAKQELKQLDQQILAAEIRLQINEHDLVVYEQQVEQAKELHDFYKNKLTKLGLYNYHATTLSRLFRQAYNMALDMAKQAERCYQFECDDPTNYIIQNDNWDSRQYGFLAGERLLFQLQQLDKAYLEKNTRRQEITQSFSLRQLNPEALLKLKIGGDTEGFEIPEWVFDLYYPGHYKRIIKSVRLSIPCVTGPYTNVPATLTLQGSEIRLSEGRANTESTARRYGKMQSISTSTANNDAGLFEFNFRDERYLPFEGAGAISEWTLSLPTAYKPFDYNTISDVIIHISYTSEIGKLPRPVELPSANNDKLMLFLSLKHDFPNKFYQLQQKGEDGKELITINHSFFPYFATGGAIKNISATAFGEGINPEIKIGENINTIKIGESLNLTITKANLIKDENDDTIITNGFIIITYSI